MWCQCHKGDSFHSNLSSPSTMALRNSPLWSRKDETCPPVTHLTSEPGQAFWSSSTECFGMYPSSWKMNTIKENSLAKLSFARTNALYMCLQRERTINNVAVIHICVERMASTCYKVGFQCKHTKIYPNRMIVQTSYATKQTPKNMRAYTRNWDINTKASYD